MRVFVAGASGAIGRRLLPMLVQAGHSVTGMTRSPERAAAIRAAGAQAVIADALDSDAVTAGLLRAAPEVVIHELTAIPADLNLRTFDRQFQETNRLRTEGTDHLLSAAHKAGARRFLAQSFAGWPYAPVGGPVKTEEDPLDPNPPRRLKGVFHAIQYLESAVTQDRGMEGIVLRYGGLYGPGNGIGEGGAMLQMVRRRQVPVIGAGTGIWSFVHVDDAARATVAAVTYGAPGIYNIVDNDPAPVAEWLPALAAAVGAKLPRRIPEWLGRLAVGQHGVALMTMVRGASNTKAKRELEWNPVWETWRDGFRHALSNSLEATLASVCTLVS